MIRPSRVGLLVAALAAASALLAGPALAVDKPPVGSADCTSAVNADPAVTAAPATGVAAAKTEATSRLCAAAASSSSTTTTTTTTTTSSSPASSAPVTPTSRPASNRPIPGNDAPTPNRPGRPAGDRDCADFATQQQAQRYFESIGGSATNNADRLDENHNGIACESLADDGDDQDAEATSTGDDGSTAKTSGDQVTEVPAGSAQTGGA